MDLANKSLVALALLGALAFALTTDASAGKGGGGKPPKGGDTIAPAAVTDLFADGVTADSMTLSWTATADDANDPASGPADHYDVRYSTDPIVDEAAWGEATQATGEPIPQASGGLESSTIGGLLPETTYYLRLKVVDEAGNESDLSNEVTATTEIGAWSIEVIDASVWYVSLAYDASGNPAIAYQHFDGSIYFAEWNGSDWDISAVGVSGDDVELAFTPAGTPGILFKSGGRKKRLKFAERTGASWTIETVDSSISAGIEIAFAYDGAGNPGAAYHKGGSIFAYRDAGGWNIESVDSGDTSFASLAFDTMDRPNVSYRFVPSGGAEELRFAVKDAGVWTIHVVDSSTTRVGNSNSLAIDPTTDYPAIAYSKGPSSGPRNLRYSRWDGSGWTNEVDVDSADFGVSGISLDFDAFGTPNVGYGLVLLSDCTGELRVAQFDGTAWAIDAIQGMSNACLARSFISLAVDSSNTPTVAYRDGDSGYAELRFATKN
ncbi:MAG: fibronectin type III domain-containing protein [Planctomycetota bacterium]|nr:fibronectin type III domain-containing protein [Planctomycetota bacterium]